MDNRPLVLVADRQPELTRLVSISLGREGFRVESANDGLSALNKVSDSQSRAEALSTGYEKGEVTDIAKVMLARQEAGIAFEATLQVRNKLLSAYQDIMRMGV